MTPDEFYEDDVSPDEECTTCGEPLGTTRGCEECYEYRIGMV